MGENTFFGSELFRFLKQLKNHNDRNWFQANKQRYESDVQQPFLNFIAAFAPRLRKINSGFVADPSPSRRSMMRIYRDIRFSKDKSPFKTFVAAHFWHVKGEGRGPAYYLRLEPGHSVVGGGMWQPDPKALKKIRDRIVAMPDAWRKATADRRLGSACEFAGESLKRAPAGYAPNHPLIEDIKRKDFAISSPLTEHQVTGEESLDLVCDGLRAATPFYSILISRGWARLISQTSCSGSPYRSVSEDCR